MTNCRVCSTALDDLIDLGEPFVSNFYDEEDNGAKRERLRLGMCPDCRLVQLMDTVDPAELYREYWYRSGTNPYMASALDEVARETLRWRPVQDGDVILDIACNDGTLLGSFEILTQNPLEGQPVTPTLVGIDPSNTVDEARAYTDKIVNEFFSADAYKNLGLPRAKIVTTIAMFYDLEDPVGFARDVHDCLADDGVWTLQLSYTPLMLKQNAFDNICAEHIEYYTLRTLNTVLRRAGFRIINAALNDTNAGSVRVMAIKDTYNGDHIPEFLRTVGLINVDSLLLAEERYGVNEPQVWDAFLRNMETLREETVRLLTNLVSQGKTVWGYGASTKGNTLLQFYDIGPDLISYIAERQSGKCGKLTAGSWIPIVSEDRLRAEQPDYVFVFPWHFQSSILEREQELIEAGTRFIFPLPRLEIIE